MQPDEYIYSPMYYSGSKNRLLYWLIPLFPKNISTFYDLFCGGLSVSVNVRAEKYVASDVSPFVINLYRAMQEAGSVGFMAKMDSYIQEYHVDDCKHESFYALRDAYNSKSDKYNSPEMLFTLVCYAYNSVLRFNSHDEYNIAPGRELHGFPNLVELISINLLMLSLIGILYFYVKAMHQPCVWMTWILTHLCIVIPHILSVRQNTTQGGNGCMNTPYTLF